MIRPFEVSGVAEVSEVTPNGVFFRYSPKKIGLGIVTYEEGRLRWNKIQKPEDKEICQLLFKDKIRITIKIISEEEYKMEVSKNG